MAKILAIDDDIDTLNLIRTVLAKRGHRVDGVQDGISAITLLEKKKYDLVITDLNMSLMSGLELIAKLRDSERTKDQLIAIITSEKDKGTVMEAINLGTQDFIIKPLLPMPLVEKIESILLKKKSTKGSALLTQTIEADAEIRLAGTVSSISVSGLMITTASRLPEGETLFIDSELFGQVGIMPPLLKVVSSKAFKFGEWKNQLEFSQVSAETLRRIKDWLLKREVRKKKSA